MNGISWGDLLLNLFSEGLGILATYLIVDKLIEKYNDKRLMTTKRIVLERLFLICNNFIQLLDIVPVDMEGKEHRVYTTFHFGTDKCVSYGSYKRYRIKEQIHDHNDVEIDYRIEYKYDPEVDGNFFDQLVDQTPVCYNYLLLMKETFGDYFDKYSDVLDQEVKDRLIRIDTYLSVYLPRTTSNNEKEGKKHKETLEKIIGTLVPMLINLRRLLEDKADDRFTLIIPFFGNKGIRNEMIEKYRVGDISLFDLYGFKKK